MRASVEQDIIITKLNKYLQWHNLPVRMNKEGICNGLASVYGKAVLENKEQQFFNLLESIATDTIAPDKEQEIDKFVIEVVLSFMPELFNLELNQTNSTQTLSIDGCTIKPCFELGLTTSDENWSAILSQLNVVTQEAVLIKSINHTVTVSKKNNLYRIYDPNYSSGYKEFSTELKLTKELHQNVFGSNKGPLGLVIQILTPPDSKPIARPTVEEIYTKYLGPRNIHEFSVTDGLENNTLLQAVSLNNSQSVQQLVNMGARDDSDFSITAAAIQNNCDQSLEVLLKSISKDNNGYIKRFFFEALSCGRKEAFDVLLNNPVCREVYDKELVQDEWADLMITRASTGGNPALLDGVLNLYQTEPRSIPSKKAIGEAIASGSMECVNLLINQIKNNGYKLGDEEHLNYLMLSIQKNQPKLVSFFIQDLPKELLSTINLSTLAVERTSLTILHELKENGIIFSDMQQGIITQKEHQPVGILLTIGIMLTKFTDYLREIANLNQSVSYDINKFRSIKARLHHMENVEPTEQKDEPSEPINIKPN